MAFNVAMPFSAGPRFVDALYQQGRRQSDAHTLDGRMFTGPQAELQAPDRIKTQISA
ncbi:hypothetical protein E4U44_005454 [Claviceps purpurea]|nr:hypothetical protein E4U44_005454 [Claviceps purpurea]